MLSSFSSDQFPTAFPLLANFPSLANLAHLADLGKSAHCLDKSRDNTDTSLGQFSFTNLFGSLVNDIDSFLASLNGSLDGFFNNSFTSSFADFALSTDSSNTYTKKFYQTQYYTGLPYQIQKTTSSSEVLSTAVLSHDTLSHEAKHLISNSSIFFNFKAGKSGTSSANCSYITRLSAIDCSVTPAYFSSEFSSENASFPSQNNSSSPQNLESRVSKTNDNFSTNDSLPGIDSLAMSANPTSHKKIDELYSLGSSNCLDNLSAISDKSTFSIKNYIKDFNPNDYSTLLTRNCFSLNYPSFLFPSIAFVLGFYPIFPDLFSFFFGSIDLRLFSSLSDKSNLANISDIDSIDNIGNIDAIRDKSSFNQFNSSSVLGTFTRSHNHFSLINSFSSNQFKGFSLLGCSTNAHNHFSLINSFPSAFSFNQLKGFSLLGCSTNIHNHFSLINFSSSFSSFSSFNKLASSSVLGGSTRTSGRSSSSSDLANSHIFNDYSKLSQFSVIHYLFSSFRLIEFNRQSELLILDPTYFHQPIGSFASLASLASLKDLSINDSLQDSNDNVLNQPTQSIEHSTQLTKQPNLLTKLTNQQSRTQQPKPQSINQHPKPQLKPQPRTYYQMKVSFPAKIPTLLAKSMVRNYLQENFSNARALAVVHQNTPHTHVHIHLQAIEIDLASGLPSGKKFHFASGKYQKLDLAWAKTYSQEFGQHLLDKHLNKKLAHFLDRNIDHNIDHNTNKDRVNLNNDKDLNKDLNKDINRNLSRDNDSNRDLNKDLTKNTNKDLPKDKNYFLNLELRRLGNHHVSQQTPPFNSQPPSSVSHSFQRSATSKLLEPDSPSQLSASTQGSATSRLSETTSRPTEIAPGQGQITSRQGLDHLPPSKSTSSSFQQPSNQPQQHFQQSPDHNQQHLQPSAAPGATPGATPPGAVSQHQSNISGSNHSPSVPLHHPSFDKSLSSYNPSSELSIKPSEQSYQRLEHPTSPSQQNIGQSLKQQNIGRADSQQLSDSTSRTLSDSNHLSDRANQQLTLSKQRIEQSNRSIERTNRLLSDQRKFIQLSNQQFELSQQRFNQTDTRIESSNRTLSVSSKSIDATNQQLQRTNQQLERTNQQLEISKQISISASQLSKNLSINTEKFIHQSNQSIKSAFQYSNKLSQLFAKLAHERNSFSRDSVRDTDRTFDQKYSSLEIRDGRDGRGNEESKLNRNTDRDRDRDDDYPSR